MIIVADDATGTVVLCEVDAQGQEHIVLESLDAHRRQILSNFEKPSHDSQALSSKLN